ncbi:UNVERIFIED_CONTAM: hypothetical protein Sangu_2923600 [Sesamum angustifolium]|uniref:Uncharacterized protein n=1 Tax=Sesamum angustifolium TaxID=2727405 RepID=A0AAW2IL88_9LAMI
MEGVVSREIEVKVSASETWKAYGSLLLAQIGVDAFPDKYSGFKVLQGDGYAGTIIQVFFAPGAAVVQGGVLGGGRCEASEGREVYRGGVLEQGFKSYVVTLEAIEKEGKKNECIMKGSIEYALYDEAALPLVTSSIEGLLALMHAVADYVTNNYDDDTTTTTN